jgi:hypothetical protein
MEGSCWAQVLLARADKDYPAAHPPPLRFIRSCSSSLAPATLERLEKAFKVPVLEVRVPYTLLPPFTCHWSLVHIHRQRDTGYQALGCCTCNLCLFAAFHVGYYELDIGHQCSMAGEVTSVLRQVAMYACVWQQGNVH